MYHFSLYSAWRRSRQLPPLRHREAGAIERLVKRFDIVLRDTGYPQGRSDRRAVVQARRPGLTRDEKMTIKGGGVPEDLVEGEASANRPRRPLDDQTRAAAAAE